MKGLSAIFHNVKEIFLKTKAVFFIRKLLLYILNCLNINEFRSIKSDERFSRLKNQIRSETKLTLSDTEAYQLFTAVEKTSKIPGDIAEVGVYKGGSAKIISSAKGGRHLYLFDTFGGLPQPLDIDILHYKGQFISDYAQVCKYLEEYPNISIYKGLFPETADVIKNKQFSLVHLDVDLYQSTLDGLKFFYPRLNKGGILISHDYSVVPGVRKAVDEFFANLTEIVIEMADSQCLIVKV